MAPKVFALVLNYKGKEDSLECLASLLKSDYPDLSVLFIDNDSEDGSLEEAVRRHPRIQTLQTGSNLGYVGGNNRGIRLALNGGAEFVFVLNNDTQIDPRAVRLLVEAAQKNLNAGILAPRVMDYEDRRVIHSCGTSMDWFRMRPRVGLFGKAWDDSMRPPVSSSVYPGSALLLTRKLLEKIGGFDESFFLVHQDADLCFRAAKSGFRCRLVPDAVVYHKLSKALSRSPFLSEYYSTRNFLRLASLHAKGMEKFLCGAGLAVYTAVNGLRSALSLKPLMRERARGFLRGVAGYRKRESGKFPNHEDRG